MANEPVKDTDPTIGRLVSDATRDISTLINKEIQLAKSELQVSLKNGGIGIGLFAGGGVLRADGAGHALDGARLPHQLERRRPRAAVGVPDRVRLLPPASPRCSATSALRKVKKVKGPEKAIAQAQETKQILKRD